MMLAALVIGYLCGSIPFGVIITKLAGAPDVRLIGSGNIGATNVLRTGRKRLAAATLVGDMLKGTVAVLLAGHFLGRDAALVAGLSAFLGHLFPVWLGFKGGKGVSTYIGLLLGLALWPALAGFFLIWLGVALAFRYSSLAALVAAAVTPAIVWWRADETTTGLFVVLSVLLFVTHRGNIARLINRTESKIGKKPAY